MYISPALLAQTYRSMQDYNTCNTWLATIQFRYVSTEELLQVLATLAPIADKLPIWKSFLTLAQTHLLDIRGKAFAEEMLGPYLA
jgi:hypothetical protein